MPWIVISLETSSGWKIPISLQASADTVEKNYVPVFYPICILFIGVISSEQTLCRTMAKSLLQGMVGLERLQQRHSPLVFQVLESPTML